MMTRKEIKKFLINIALFVIILVFIDFVLGSITQKIFFSQKTGKYARATYAIKEADENIIVLGSSHAHRHYVPEVFKQEIGKTAFNAGAEGQQLLYHFGLLKMILKKESKPDLIILNIDDYFLYDTPVAYDRLNDLHPYYGEYRDELYPILKLNSDFVDLKLFFKGYQTNSTLVHALRYYASPQTTLNGYRPLYGKVTKESLNSMTIFKEHTEKIEGDFVWALKELIKTAKSNDVKLIFVTSPNVLEKDLKGNKSFNKIKQIAKEGEILFLDYYNDKRFLNQYDIFHDISHLNDDGARLFTKILSKDLLDRGAIQKGSN